MNKWTKGCLGCLGAWFLISILVGGCSALFTKDESVDDELKKYEKELATTEEEKKEDEKLDKEIEKQLKELDKKAVGSDNKVFGAFNDLSAEIVSDGVYYDKKNKIRYLHDNDYIYWIEKGFDTKLGINASMDKEFIIDHAKDYMESDAIKTTDLSDHEFVFHSNKINKDYYVTISITDNNIVDRVIITSIK
ncbi:hypothetical protein [Macrococcoides bohemicum]|uniref:hypothetical protein n=1 Tax=Macrococcoides bohemicum TaxID=1903056 RepID=UPI00165E2025|nr:hypothetical protein [Macrococcus bohemicus]MBC9873659.1 hypothetical protein [Macrococcus bohemicus]